MELHPLTQPSLDSLEEPLAACIRGEKHNPMHNQSGFAANSATQSKDDELTAQMVNSHNNLAMTAVQKNETMEKLTEMNNQKDKIIASLTESLKKEKATNRKLMALI